jgi:hypothetical protein
MGGERSGSDVRRPFPDHHRTTCQGLAFEIFHKLGDAAYVC